MTPRSSASHAAGGELGRLLRHWRKVRGTSQIELSLDTGVSQKHLSFIESGRSAPSRPTLILITRALDVPFRDRNELLVAAGYAPVYREDAWNAQEMGAVTRALERVLHQHEPYPALVMDRYWNVHMRNDAALRFFNAFIDLGARPEPRNMLHLMFDPAGMRPHLANWDEASAALIRRIHREAVGHTLDTRTRDLLDALLAYPDVDIAVHADDDAEQTPALPMVPLAFRHDGQVLRYFSMITTVGTPQTITTQELRIESMFPADDATERAHERLMRAMSAT